MDRSTCICRVQPLTSKVPLARILHLLMSPLKKIKQVTGQEVAPILHWCLAQGGAQPCGSHPWLSHCREKLLDREVASGGWGVAVARWALVEVGVSIYFPQYTGIPWSNQGKWKDRQSR